MFWILDVGVILVFILAILIGARRGLIGSIAKILGGFIRLVLSIVLAKPVVKLISLTKIDERLFDNISSRCAGISEKFNVNLVGMDEQSLNTFVVDALSDAKVPKLFRGFFINLFSISPESLATKESVNLSELMGVAIGNIILLIISFVSLLLILWLITKLIIKLSRRSTKSNTIFAKTNKWLGGVFGFIKAILVVFVVFVCISFFSDFAFMETVISFINSTHVCKFLYRISEALINSSFNIKQMIENWIVK